MVTAYGGTNAITKEASELREMYRQRTSYVQAIADLLELEERVPDPIFAVENLVTNDPRTLWNMAVFLLQPRPLINTVTDVDGRELLGDVRVASEVIEQFLNRQWRDINERHMGRGKSGLYWEIVGALSAIGWYAVPYGMYSDRLWVNYWEPTGVYPDWSDDVEIGMVKIARIREITYDEAKRVASMNSWEWKPSQKYSAVTEYRLWKKIGGSIHWGVSFNNDIVRPMAMIEGLTEIPVVAGGVGALPDLIVPASRVRKDRPQRGASILDSNRSVYEDLNRSLSFMQQLIHDTANPKTYEQHARGDVDIIGGPEQFYKRGAHFKIRPDEDIGVIDLPTIPPEATQVILTLRNMIQRGGFSDATFGNIAGQVTALVISQSAEAAQQIITPYHQAMEYICTTITRYWLENILKNPSGYSFLSNTEQQAMELFNSENVRYRAISHYSVQVPGDTAARIVMAKQASPGFELSPESAMRMFMPEIIDPQQEIAKVRAARAENHPVFETVRVANAMRQAAEQARENDPELAEIMEQGSDALIRSIGGDQSDSAVDQLQQQGGGAAPGAPPSAVSPELSSVLSGGGNDGTSAPTA